MVVELMAANSQIYATQPSYLVNHSIAGWLAKFI